MSRSIPIRDLAGQIIGLRDENEPDPVQATLDASMKAVGAPTITHVQPESTQKPARPASPPLLRIVIGAVIVAIWAIGLVLLAGRTPSAPRIAPAISSTVQATNTLIVIPTATLSPTTEPTATASPTEIPTEIPNEVSAPAQLPLPPSAAVFCADRYSLWGETHQCASSQDEADAIADAEIARINAEAEAKRKQH